MHSVCEQNRFQCCIFNWFASNHAKSEQSSVYKVTELASLFILWCIVHILSNDILDLSFTERKILIFFYTILSMINDDTKSAKYDCF